MKKIISGIMELNLPNKLTLLRMALVPVYLVLLAYGYNWLALIVFAIASITDALDGKIARKYNLITNFGKFMDPIADKLLTHTAFILLCAMGRLNVAACIALTGYPQISAPFLPSYFLPPTMLANDVCSPL